MPCATASETEIIITPEGDEVHRYDMARFYQWHLPCLPFMDELMEAGYSAKDWEDLDDEDIGQVADLLNLFAQTPDYLSPELRQPVASAQELAEALAPWLLPPGNQPSAQGNNSEPRYQSQKALQLFDTEGETAALRYILDSHTQLSSGAGARLFELPDGSAVTRDSRTGEYRFLWTAGEARRSEQSEQKSATSP